MDCKSGCCSTGRICPCPEQGNPEIDSLEKLINCYWQSQQHYEVEKAWYGELSSLDQAVREAALALADENAGLDHVPDRIALTELATAKQRLLDALAPLRDADDFDALYALVRPLLADLDGIDAELAYATAVRIGMQAGLEPQRIYLHDAQVRGSAACLVELEDGLASLEKRQLPGLLQHPDLPAAVIQGCLALCGNQVRWLRQNGTLT